MSVYMTGGQAAERVNYVEWIETTGTQYIDMEISVPHAASRVVIEFAPMEISADNPIAGTTYPSWSWDTNIAFVSATKILVANTYGPVVEKGVFYKFEYTSTYYRINDGDKVSMTNRSYRDGYNNTVSFASGKYGKNRIKHYQLYNGDVLVRDCYACIDPDGVVCMYDEVEKKYRYNAGTGEFVAGGDNGGSDENLISFTINGIAYKAERDMTWAQWVASGYNTGGFVILSIPGGSAPCLPDPNNPINNYLVGYQGSIVISTAYIIANAAYTAG